jgi:hypothetical protein
MTGESEAIPPDWQVSLHFSGEKEKHKPDQDNGITQLRNILFG